MKRLCFVLTIGCLLALAGSPAEVEGKACQLDGVWYGNNTYGGDLVMTITKTGGGHYTALAMNPETSAQGEFIFKRRGQYETTWMTYVDNGDGTWLAAYMYGDVEMTGCGSWTAETTWDLYLFVPQQGQDPFDDGVLIDSIEIELNYWRMP